MNESNILERIRAWLTDEGVEFREVHHEPTLTSVDSAKARGEDLRTGGKALLMKAGDQFRLFVMPADLKADSGRIRKSGLHAGLAANTISPSHVSGNNLNIGGGGVSSNNYYNTNTVTSNVNQVHIPNSNDGIY